MGTYSEFSKEVQVHIHDQTLYISDPEAGEVIGTHKISNEKGILIQDRAHTRDRTKGIQAYKQSTAVKFENSSLALEYLDEVNNQYPRYIRDQLQLINKMWGKFPNQYINEGLVMCMDQKLYSASEFQDMVEFLIAQRPITSVKKPKDIQPLNGETSYLLDIKPPIRDIAPYMAIMEGGDPS